jgi:hypothetical protein
MLRHEKDLVAWAQGTAEPIVNLLDRAVDRDFDRRTARRSSLMWMVYA